MGRSMSVECTIRREDIDELKRLHMTLVKAVPGQRWPAQSALIGFIEQHPTLLPVLCEIGIKNRTETPHAG